MMNNSWSILVANEIFRYGAAKWDYHGRQLIMMPPMQGSLDINMIMDDA